MVAAVTTLSYLNIFSTGNKIAIFLLSIGSVMCLFSYREIPGMFDGILTDVIRKMLVLSPSSEFFQMWVEADIPIYQKMYFFDIKNIDEIRNGGKPRVEEVGPYTYSVKMKMENITFEGNNTLSYRKHMLFTFMPEMSAGAEDDIFTTVNFPFATAASSVKSESWFAKMTISALGTIHDQGMFQEISVRDMLWGARNPLLKQLQTLIGDDLIKSDEFGMLLGKNNTIDENVYTVDTGEGDQSLLNTIVRFNDEESLDCWGDDTANMINGTDGTFYHPFVSTEETLYVFNPFMFRSFPYIYREDFSYKGVPLHEFTLPDYAYASPSEFPPNAGFCLSEPCAPSGILDISPCAMGVPMSISNPHFLHGDESLLNSIDGLNATESLHKSYMGIEPMMGIPYRFDQRVQINFRIEEIDGISQTSGIKPLHYPLMWIETHGAMPDSIVAHYKTNIEGSYEMIEIIKIVCIVCGSLQCLTILTIIVFAVFRFVHRRHDRKQVHVKQVTQDDSKLKTINNNNNETHEKIAQEEPPMLGYATYV